MAHQSDDVRVPPLPSAHSSARPDGSNETSVGTQTEMSSMVWWAGGGRRETEEEDQTATRLTSWPSIASTDSGLGSGESMTEDLGEEVESVMDKLSRGVSRLLRPNQMDRSTQTLKDPMVWETEKLAFDIVFFTTGKRSSKPSDEVMQCLRNNVQKMLSNHSMVFNSMMSKLRVDRDSDIQRGFTTLAEELFTGPGTGGGGGGGVSWGKVVALYAFGARLALYCKSEGMEDMVIDIAGSLAHFAVRKLTPFLRQHGGWPTLCEAFPLQSDYESKVWTSLLVTGLGLTTVAAFVALMR